MKLLKIFQAISIFLFILFECATSANIWFGVLSVLFLLVFYLLYRLEETCNDRKEIHMRYINRKRDRDNDIAYTTYDSNGNEHFTE